MPYPPIDPPTAERQSLDDVRNWHRDVVAALAAHRLALRVAIRLGTAVPAPFAALTDREVEARFDLLRLDLDRLATLNLVASAEASIRVDYARRVRKGRDALSSAYQAWHQTLSDRKQRRPDFDEGGILDVMKDSAAVDRHLVGQFRKCLRSRHWLGHGRYWGRPAEVDQLDPDEVYGRGRAILSALPA